MKRARIDSRALRRDGMHTGHACMDARSSYTARKCLTFFALVVACVGAAAALKDETPDDIWIQRINKSRGQRIEALNRKYPDVEHLLIVDWFRTGRGRNYFVSVGVASNRLDMAVDDESAISTTNMVVELPMNVISGIRRELPACRYRKHAGMCAGWVQVSMSAPDGGKISRWFDVPFWPQSKDKEILGSLMFSGKTKDDDAWRMFHSLYRAIKPTVNKFYQVLDRAE